MNAGKDSHISQRACIAKYSLCTESDLNFGTITPISSKEKLPRITLISLKGCCQPLSQSRFNVLCYSLYTLHPMVGKQDTFLFTIVNVTIISSYPALLRKSSLCFTVCSSVCTPCVSKPLVSSKKLEES